MKNKFTIVAIAAFLMLLMACNPETPLQYHKVNYIGADGNVMETHYVESGKTDIPPQENPINVGYKFIGWSLSENGKSIYDFKTPVKGELTLYPVWEINSYKVTFIYGEDVVNPPSEITLDYGSTIPPQNATKTGFRLNGWSTKEDGSELYDFSTPVTGDVTLYPVWVKTCTITYVCGEDVVDAPEDITVDINTVVEAPEDPSKTGYTFKGWKASLDSKDFFSFGSITSDVTLYPVWEINSYKVMFICGEDVVNPPSEITLDYGSTIPPQNATKTGFRLNGWSTKEDGSELYDLSTPITGDVTLYPVWVKTCTITYVCGEDVVDAPEDITVDINTVVEAPEEPSKTGYTFKGWKASLDSKDFFSFGSITSDVTLYPVWEINSYKVTFICGEDVVNPPSEITLDYGSTIPPQDVTRTGYHLKGWSLKEDGSEPYDFSTPVTGDVTLYPVWVKTCTITYVCGEDVVDAPEGITVDINTVVEAPEEPSKTGYTFKGWKASLDSKDFFSFGSITSDVTLYPVWEINSYKVTFICGEDVVNPPSEITVDHGSTIPPQNATKTGFRLNGWSTKEDGSELYDFSTPVTGPVALYPVWVKTCTITYICGEDVVDAPEDITVDINTVVEAPEEPSKTGYTFKGWKASLDSKDFFSFGSITSDVTLYPVWEINSYKVSFICGEDVVDPPSEITLDHGSTIPPQNATKTGFRLNGWSTKEDGSELYDFSTPVTGPVTLYPVWVKTCTITYVCGEDVVDAPEDITVDINTVVEAPEEPSKTGYTFKGWKASLDSKDFFSFGSITSDVTLYPVWEINSYKVTFICGEDVVNPPSEITLDYGSTIPPQNATKTGFRLNGWSTKEDGSELYDFSTPVTGDVTLYPVWVKTCTITYICGEDVVDAPEDITVDINTVVEAPEDPSKTGYTFKGWKASLDSKDFFSFGSIKSDVILYPIFEGKEMTVNFIYVDEEPINSKTLRTGDKVSLSDLVFKLFEKDYALDERIYTLKLVDAGTGTPYSLDDPLPYNETGFTFVCHISSNLLTVDGSGAVAGTNALVDIEGPYTLIIPRYINGVKASTIKETGFYYSGWDKKYQFDKLILPNTLTSIGENAFDSCGNLAEVEIPSSVELINAGSFNYCTTLSKINIPEGVETIGAGVFANCYALSEINLPSSLATIGEFSFSSCGFVSFTLPKQFTVVPAGMLYSCTKLTTVIFEGDITTIGAHAFAGCDALTSFTIPDTVTTIEDGVFSNCKNLETITLPSNANITEVSNYLFNGCWKLTDITIPPSVQRIGDNAFYSCKSLQSITIPEKVTTIGANAFSSSGLTSITIPARVTSIGAYAFQGCNSLASIKINGEIVTIQERTFDSCTSLKSIKIPDSVTTIGESAFALSGLTSFTIPNNVTSLGNNTFSRCNNLNSITIGTGVSSIPRKAFEFCSSLESITIPSNVETIEDNAFLNCTSLSSITLNVGLQQIGNNVIEDCSSLATITIPSSVTSIEENAFYHCQNLSTIYIDQTINSIDGAPWAGDELWSQNENKKVKKSNFSLQWKTK